MNPLGLFLEPPGPLLTHLHTVCMAYSERLPTRLSPLAERTCFSQGLAERCGSSADTPADLLPPPSPHCRPFFPVLWRFSVFPGFVIHLLTARAVAAYIERPQVLLNGSSGEPQTFFAGLGRSSYDDSVTWAAPFCTAEDPPGACGPTGNALGPWSMPPPPPPAPPARCYWSDGRCLATNDTGAKDCPPPPPAATGAVCPVLLTSACAGANSVRTTTTDPHSASTTMVNKRSGAAINLDGNSCGDGTSYSVFDEKANVPSHEYIGAWCYCKSSELSGYCQPRDSIVWNPEPSDLEL